MGQSDCGPLSAVLDWDIGCSIEEKGSHGHGRFEVTPLEAGADSIGTDSTGTDSIGTNSIGTDLGTDSIGGADSIGR